MYGSVSYENSLIPFKLVKPFIQHHRQSRYANPPVSAKISRQPPRRASCQCIINSGDSTWLNLIWLSSFTHPKIKSQKICKAPNLSWKLDDQNSTSRSPGARTPEPSIQSVSRHKPQARTNGSIEVDFQRVSPCACVQLKCCITLARDFDTKNPGRVWPCAPSPGGHSGLSILD